MKALNEFGEKLENLGYGKEFFCDEYLGEPWFDVIYNEVLGENNEEEKALEGAFVKNMLSDVSKIRMFCNTYI